MAMPPINKVGDTEEPNRESTPEGQKPKVNKRGSTFTPNRESSKTGQMPETHKIKE